MTRTRNLGFCFAIAMSVAAVAAAQTSPIADAARRSDKEAVRALLKQGADVSAPHADGMTALHWAAEQGDAALVEILLYAGANTGAVTRLGQYTPLHLAARSGAAPVVRALLKAGAQPATASASGATALHLAAASGSADAVTALLDAGADVNVRESESGQTPLIFAASAGQLSTISVLLKRGADVKIASKTIDLAKQQALDRQATALRRQILQSTVARGEQPTPSQEQAAVQAMRELYTSGKAPEPPAAAAAGGGRGGRGGGGAGGGGAGGSGGAPDAAAGGTPQGRGGNPTGAAGGAGQPQSATDLQNAEGPPPAMSAKGGLTALHHAARQGHTRAAIALLDAGADINQKSGDGHTPLLVALVNGQFDMSMLFVERGANPNRAADGLGVTPLWAAVNAQWQPRTRFPQPQEMDLQKATYLDVMKALLEAGADPDARVRVHPWYMVYTGCGNGNCGLTSVVGSTAFWRAAYGTDVEAMRLLVKYGADPNIPTMAAAGRGGGGGGRGGAAGRGGGAGGAGAGGPGPGGAQAPGGAPAPAAGGQGPGGPGAGGGGDQSGVPPVPPGGPGVYAIHAASGVEYGEGYAGNAHRHAPDNWLAAVKYLVEELGMDVNMRDNDGYNAVHHAAARGDNELILYLVSKGGDVKAISRRGQTTADMANGPVSRISPFPDTIALLVKLGAKNNNRCASCAP
jgi:uncharacterized protein